MKKAVIILAIIALALFLFVTPRALRKFFDWQQERALYRYTYQVKIYYARNQVIDTLLFKSSMPSYFQLDQPGILYFINQDLTEKEVKIVACDVRRYELMKTTKTINK